MATIKDIAARLGVSISTVSKGLNGASDISEELRQTVLDTAVEMGYSTKRSRKVENRKLALFIENMNYESIDEFGYDVVPVSYTHLLSFGPTITFTNTKSSHGARNAVSTVYTTIGLLSGRITL